MPSTFSTAADCPVEYRGYGCIEKGDTVKKNTLLRTNLLVCTIIIIGFIITSYIGFHSNIDVFERDAERVSNLAAEGIYNQIDKILSEPINVSLTMANDNLLKRFLSEEAGRMEDVSYVEELRDYLFAYREKYSYDSVFLVSTATNRYYHFAGLNRVLAPDNPENVWYYDFLKSEEEYSLNVDNDEAADDCITVFVNCKIRDGAGRTLGVIGVGLKVDSLQELLKEYDKQYGVRVHLVDQQGFVRISSLQAAYERTSLFEDGTWSNFKDSILDAQAGKQAFWYTLPDSRGYAISQYVPELKWHLIVQYNMTAMDRRLSMQMYGGIAVIICIIAVVLLIITRVLQTYKAHILMLSTSQRQEYQRLLHQATEAMYENIFEFDITHNGVIGESTQQYLEMLGIKTEASYDLAISVLSRQVKEEYKQGYLDTFSREHVLEAYHQGVTNLVYDLLLAKDDVNYRWMRINAHVFYWTSDESVRMISYRANIDGEKERERYLLENARRDSMTGLYNKGTTEKLVADVLERDREAKRTHAYIIFDIDDFKNINDKYGHDFGDHVIKEFAMEIQLQFRESDIVGRIGGDEFSALMLDCQDLTVLCEKLERCCKRISLKNFGRELAQGVSVSIGAALFPAQGQTYAELFSKADEALYFAKAHGKNTFHVQGAQKKASAHSRLDFRALRNVLEGTSDGVAKYAYDGELKLLYYNKPLAKMLGSTREYVDVQTLDPYSYVHAQDLSAVQEAIRAASLHKAPIDMCFRLKREDGTYGPVRLRGIFTNEVYEDCGAIFYAVYTDLTPR